MHPYDWSGCTEAISFGYRDHTSGSSGVYRQRDRRRWYLALSGRNYPFKLGGLGIGGIGVSRLDATGTVYNLKRLQDFEGVYGQTRVGWAAGKEGSGQMWLKNTNGVYMQLKAQRKGLALSLGADGMVIDLGS